MPTATFEQVLSNKPAPRRLGNVRLRYDAQLVIGQTVPPLDLRALAPDAMLVVAAACGLFALIALVLPPLRGNGAWAFGFAAMAAWATWTASRAAARRRARRFVVNFDSHVVRIDAGPVLILEAPFAGAQVSVVATKAQRWALQLHAQGRSEVLIDEVPDEDRAALDGVAKLLTEALGA